MHLLERLISTPNTMQGYVMTPNTRNLLKKHLEETGGQVCWHGMYRNIMPIILMCVFMTEHRPTLSCHHDECTIPYHTIPYHTIHVGSHSVPAWAKRYFAHWSCQGHQLQLCLCPWSRWHHLLAVSIVFIVLYRVASHCIFLKYLEINAYIIPSYDDTNPEKEEERFFIGIQWVTSRAISHHINILIWNAYFLYNC